MAGSLPSSPLPDIQLLPIVLIGMWNYFDWLNYLMRPTNYDYSCFWCAYAIDIDSSFLFQLSVNNYSYTFIRNLASKMTAALC
uniref:Uncharacterized protein n=1 Tax=Glossina palpalis gambiensis TaxID=67801 RepID=A0A1B0B6B3_9MUSC